MRLALFLVVSVLVCGGQTLVILTGLFGTFTSPDFPEPYADFLDLAWKIEVRQGYRIGLKFTSFDLEDSYEIESGPCVYDYVLVSEGDTEHRFCGRYNIGYYDAPRPGQEILSKGNVLNVTFVSDYSNEGRKPLGFSAHYKEYDIDECALMRYKEAHTVEDWDELVTCSHFCNNVPGSFYCSCRAGFELHSNEHTCVAKFCEKRELRDDEGVIESPDYPRPYAKLSHCEWDVLVRDGLSVHFTFDREFGVEEHTDDGCVYDVLSLDYSGKSVRYCGKTAPNNGTVIDMNTRHVIVKFDTDLSVEMAGFRINYNTSRIRCLKELNHPSNGEINSPNPKGYYEFEDVVNYTCNRGYDLIGSSRLECLSNGKWDHLEPTCKIKSCGIPDELLAVKYSSIVDYGTKHFTYLEVLTVECDEWYELAGGTAKWRCEDSKKWVRHDNVPNRKMPVCRPRCGHRLVEDDFIDSHVSGSKPVKKQGGWPWMAYISLSGERTDDQFCGGTLVDELTVVTAAHCVNPIDVDESVDVYLGILDRKKDNFNFTQKFTVPQSEIFIHSAYDQSNAAAYDSDIAVLKLDSPVEFSFWVHPICVPVSAVEKNLAETFRGSQSNAVVTGWGKTETGHPSDVLLKTRMPVVDRETCKLSYKKHFGTRELITNNMFCAGFPTGKNDACQGDSGGPFMTYIDGNPKKWFLSGIVSFGDERKAFSCGKADTYGVYTDVGKFDVFLSANME